MTIDTTFAVTKDYLYSVKDRPEKLYYHKQIMRYLENIDLSGYVLDIGYRNPLTERIEQARGIKIDSTDGDLDETLICPRENYDVVIFNHVIEHLFNPLLCLQNIRKVMKPAAMLIIGTPVKPHFITPSKGHFHEMDEYRFRKLIKRAGFKIRDWKKYYVYKNITWRSFTGIRPFVRIFYKCHSIIELIKK